MNSSNPVTIHDELEAVRDLPHIASLRAELDAARADWLQAAQSQSGATATQIEAYQAATVAYRAAHDDALYGYQKVARSIRLAFATAEPVEP